MTKPSRTSKIIQVILIGLLTAICGLAQSTTVTATVVDQTSVVWANGTWKLDLVPSPSSGAPPYWNGVLLPNTQWHYSGVLDASGNFSQSVPSNNFITPTGSTYTVTVCPNATAPCVVINSQTFQGTTQNISSIITNNAPAPVVNPLPLARAYNDSQVMVSPTQVGYFYLNVTTNTPRYWNGALWNNFGAGGVTSITVGNLPPLFTSTVNTTIPSTPAITFAQQTTTANTIYGNCTAGTTTPSFCALNPTMIGVAGTLTNDTSGNSATTTKFATSPTGCPANQFSVGIGPFGNSSCFQVNFTNLAGNIAVGQMNNGTGASAATYWAGDGTWKTTPSVPSTVVKSASNSSICTTGSSSYSVCTATITWPSAFADTAYQASCFGNTPSDPRAYINGITAKTTTSVTVQVVTGGSVAITYGSIECIGVHP